MPCTRSLVLIAAAAAGCSGGDTPPTPTSLVDGTPARSPPIALEGVERPSVMTRSRVLSAVGSIDVGPGMGSCLASAPPDGVVIRIGASGASATFRGEGEREVHACDASSSGTRRPSWCGRAFGRLDDGRLRDPRLSLTCRDDEGDPLGFAWVQPGAGASYVVIARRGYGEVYPLRGDLPVRVTTDDVDVGRTSATFAVSEHAGDGRRLRSYELEARVSG
jgi:hypothetical protein